MLSYSLLQKGADAQLFSDIRMNCAELTHDHSVVKLNKALAESAVMGELSKKQ